MSEMEEKLNAILSNPEMMQQIMSLAQSFGQKDTSQEAAAPVKAPDSPIPPGLDLSALQKLSGIAGPSGIDPEQKELLHALTPYLSRDRVSKLERAMRAARIARQASAFLNSGGFQLLTGR